MKRVLAVLLASCVWSWVGAVPLFLTPETTGPVVGEVAVDDPVLASAQSVTDPTLAAAGWKTLLRNGEYRGYVSVRRIGKNLLPQPGERILTKADENSPVLTTLEAGDAVRVLWTGDWWELSIEKSLRVFFVAPPPALAAPLPLVEPAAVAHPAALATAPAADPVPVLTVPKLAAPVRPAQVAQPKNPADRLALDFDGVVRSTQAVFSTPPFGHELVDADEARIAYLDLSAALMPGMIRDYVGQRVTVHGYREELSEKKDPVIRVVTLRRK